MMLTFVMRIDSSQSAGISKQFSVEFLFKILHKDNRCVSMNLDRLLAVGEYYALKY